MGSLRHGARGAPLSATLPAHGQGSRSWDTDAVLLPELVHLSPVKETPQLMAAWAVKLWFGVLVSFTRVVIATSRGKGLRRTRCDDLGA